MNHLNTDQKCEYLQHLTTETLHDMIHAIEHVLAQREGRMCHMADYGGFDFHSENEDSLPF